MKRFSGPVLFRGTDKVAYRDPAAVYHAGVWHLYFTYVDNSADGPWMYLGESTSRDLVNWSPVKLLTAKDKRLNYSSPGNIIRDGDDFVICFQTYPRENGEKYGNANSRLYTMRSKDLVSWTEPELIRVKGPDVKFEDMGRMIDPYLLRRGEEWWCFFKQNGVSYSKSADLKTWTFMGHTDAGENACVIPFENGWRMFTSPENGLRVMDSDDLVSWHIAMPDVTLGQSEWDWAKGRLTAGFVIENQGFVPSLARYIMFFHASAQPETEDFDKNASIGIAFSENLTDWIWP